MHCECIRNFVAISSSLPCQRTAKYNHTKCLKPGWCPQLGTFKVDAFEKCGLRISISHFGHNSADFKYPLRAETESTHFHCPSSVLSVVRVSKKCCIIKTRIKKCWRSHSVIYFSQISLSITNSAHPWPHIIKHSSDSQDRKYPIYNFTL